jgi:hypothetical protein
VADDPGAAAAVGKELDWLPIMLLAAAHVNTHRRMVLRLD